MKLANMLGKLANCKIVSSSLTISLGIHPWSSWVFVFVILYHHDWLKASHCHLFNLLFFSNDIYLNMTLLSYFSCLVVAVAFFDMALWPYPIFFKSSFLFFTCDSYCTTSSLAHGLICLHLASLDFWYHSLVSYILLLMKGPNFLVGLSSST